MTTTLPGVEENIYFSDVLGVSITAVMQSGLIGNIVMQSCHWILDSLSHGTV